MTPIGVGRHDGRVAMETADRVAAAGERRRQRQGAHDTQAGCSATFVTKMVLNFLKIR